MVTVSLIYYLFVGVVVPFFRGSDLLDFLWVRCKQVHSEKSESITIVNNTYMFTCVNSTESNILAPEV